MSFGALSKPAVRALSHGAKAAGCWLNTGEGGLAPYHLEGGADVVFQIGTAKYGVRTADGRLDDAKLAEVAALDQVRMFELKLSQGAKPGKGGILPAVKVTREIAKIRGIAPFKDSISPNRHPEIGNVPELLIDSGDGGTGAAPMPLMDNVGLPIREALPMVVDLLASYDLRDRIKIFCSGKLITPAEVGWA
jgi:glutamate synthase domain-containing protein 2